MQRIRSADFSFGPKEEIGAARVPGGGPLKSLRDRKHSCVCTATRHQLNGHRQPMLVESRRQADRTAADVIDPSREVPKRRTAFLDISQRGCRARHRRQQQDVKLGSPPGEFDRSSCSRCGGDGNSLRRQLLRCEHALAECRAEGAFARLEERLEFLQGGSGDQHARLLREGGQIGCSQHFLDLEAESLEGVRGTTDSVSHGGYPIDRPEALGRHGDTTIGCRCQWLQ